MKEVQLTRGLKAVVDDEDFEKVTKYKWWAHKGRHCWYARRSYKLAGKKKKQYLHRFLLSVTSGSVVDHIDGNGLNNIRRNIRVCTTQQNARNRHRSLSGTPFRGVSYRKDRGTWQAYITLDYKKVSLGTFAKVEDAIRIREEAAITYFGEFYSKKSLDLSV